MRPIRVTIVAVGRLVGITYPECVSEALFIQHAMRIHPVLSTVTYLTLIYFSILSHKRQDF